MPIWQAINSSTHTYRYNRFIHVYPIVNGRQLKPIRIDWFGTDGKDFIH
ncbi:MAG: hypothetical protein PUF39_05325 [Prevotellaceae bacterium]|nr:hypothetical protein [Prevotellaceae bacterium]